MKKIPKHTKVTDKDLMIYRVTLELERVIEQGWYEDKRKHEDIETEKDTDSDEIRKKIKIGGVDAKGSKENISLGSVGLKRFEENGEEE